MLTKFISWLFHNHNDENTAIFNSIRITAIVKQLTVAGLLDMNEYEDDIRKMVCDIMQVQGGIHNGGR